MNSFRILSLVLLSAVIIGYSSCGKEDGPDDEFADNVWVIETSQDYNTTAQEAMINVENNDTIHFKAGTYNIQSQLSISGKSGIVIRGEGRENTILDFSEQLAGAQGVLATDMTNLIFADITIQDTEGDGIKVKDAQGLSFIRVGAVFTGGISSDNGAYGLYPVTSKDVLVQDC
ncbi:MAG: parallel beta-helix repeat protein, partial [Limisphaerales bacterium]